MDTLYGEQLDTTPIENYGVDTIADNKFKNFPLKGFVEYKQLTVVATNGDQTWDVGTENFDWWCIRFIKVANDLTGTTLYMEGIDPLIIGLGTGQDRKFIFPRNRGQKIRVTNTGAADTQVIIAATTYDPRCVL